MSASSDLQQALMARLGQEGSLRVAVPIVTWRPHDLAAGIEAAAANQGLCVQVMPPLPTRAMQGVPFVFFESAEVRVRIVERPALNTSGADVYDLVDDVAAALHWQAFPQMLAHPLQLSTRPTEVITDPAARIIEVIFEATYGFAPPA